MKIKLIENPHSEVEIQITYPILDTHVKNIIQKIQNMELKVLGTNEKGSKMLSLEEIYYVESVDRKTFLYTSSEVYRCNKKVYQLAEEWEEYGFVQIGKALLINMERLVEVRPLWNSRLEATLENSEKLIIARTYIKKVKEWLERKEI